MRLTKIITNYVLLDMFQIPDGIIRDMDFLIIDEKKCEKLGYNISTVNECAKLINSRMYAKVLPICDESLKSNPRDPLVLSQKGLAYMRMNQLDNAIKCFDLGIESNPEIVNNWYNKASAKALQNYESDALSFLEKAISLDSRCIKIAKNDEDFWLLKNNSEFISLVGN